MRNFRALILSKEKKSESRQSPTLLVTETNILLESQNAGDRTTISGHNLDGKKQFSFSSEIGEITTMDSCGSTLFYGAENQIVECTLKGKNSSCV